MGKWFDIKVQARLGSDVDDDQELIILNRIARCKDWVTEYEASPKDGKDEEGDAEKARGEEATTCRALAAKLNFLARHIPDLQSPAKKSAGPWQQSQKACG